MSGCSKTPKAPIEPIIDESIAPIERLQSLSDVSAVALEWEPNFDPLIHGYYIYRKPKEDAQAKFKRIAVIDDRFVSHYVDLDLPSGQKYLYKVSAFNKLGHESKPSTIISTITRPTFKSVVYITSIDNLPRRAKIIWRPHQNERISGYIIQRKEPDEKEWKQVGKLDHRYCAEFIDTQLKDNTIYMYRVLATTYDGIYSTASDIVQVTTKPLPVPTKEANTTLDLPQKIILTWEKHPQDDISHYNIYRSLYQQNGFVLHAKKTTTEFVDEIPEHGKGFFYQIAAEDYDGLEAKRTKSWFGQTITRPDGIKQLNVVQDGNKTVLSWVNTDKRVTGFYIDVQTKEGWLDVKSKRFKTDQATFTYTQSPGVSTVYTIRSFDKYNIESESLSTNEILYKEAKE
jgi:fibronectin type 3 domain-containing protein